MWFAKWFGGRKQTGEDDEPARFTPPETRTAAQPAPIPAKITGKAPAGTPSKKGFDPYNSGTFERGNAWERVNRR